MTSSPRRSLLDVAVAAVLVALATGAVLAGVAPPVRLAALLVAVAAVVLVVSRRSPVGGWEVIGTATGVLLAVLAAAGVLLDRLPGGIDRAGWGVTAGSLGVLTLVVAATRPVLRSGPRPRIGLVLSVAAAGVVVAVAIGVALTGSRLVGVPPTQMWLDVSADGREIVVIRAPGPAGPFDLWLEPEDGTPVLVTSGLSVAGGQPREVTLPSVTVRSSLVLRSPAAPDPVRSLVVEPD